MAGARNSSLTRVQPIFRELLKNDPTGQRWLSLILRLAAPPSPRAEAVLPCIRSLLPKTEKERFERRVPPPTAFLRWLIEHPERMTWPKKHGKRKDFGEAAQEWREKLLGFRTVKDQQEAKQRALDLLDRYGASKSAQEWWAFEGFTSVDCYLETESLLLFVEGKRTEPLSPSTEWYSARCQLIRNIETAKEMAGGREYGVLLATEKETELGNLDVRATDSLPHLTEKDRQELSQHFFGCLLWGDICRVTGLDFTKIPDVVPEPGNVRSRRLRIRTK